MMLGGKALTRLLAARVAMDLRLSVVRWLPCESFMKGRMRSVKDFWE